MNPSLKPIIAGTAGLLLGWAATRQVAAKATTQQQPSTATSDAPASSPAHAPNNTGKPGPRHDFAKLRRIMRDRNFLPQDAQQSIERMSDQELRDLLTAPWPDGVKLADPTRYSVNQIAAMELFRRDAEGSLQWAEGLGANDNPVLGQLVRIAVQEDPRLAKPWVDKLKDDQPFESWKSQMARLAIEGAVSRGADAVLEAEEIFGDDVPGFAVTMDEFDPHFDFAKLVAKSRQDEFRSQVLKVWASIDREAAFKGVTTNIASGDNKAPSLAGVVYTGVATTSGETGAAQWIAGKLTDLSPEVRKQIISSLSFSETPSEARVEAIMNALPSQQDRSGFIASHYSPYATGDSMLTGLKMLGSQEAQVETLTAAASHYRLIMETNPSQGRIAADRFEDTMNALNLPEDQRIKIRAAYSK